MFLFDFFRSFLPLHNPLGFGAGDFLLLILAAMLAAAALFWRPGVEAQARRLAERAGWSMLLLAALPVVLRLALLAHHPVPRPDVYDEFGHLLMADTLRHFRLANPPHALSQFFETQFVLQQPAYSSIYPPGLGLILAIGWSLFGHPWAGVLLATAALCSLSYWMLRGWTTPGWALAGGALAVIEFGPLSQWTNSYWGGAAAAAAGCLVFGALPRLFDRPRTRDAVLLGVGLGLHMLIRPFESVLLVMSVLLFFAPLLRKTGQLRRLARFVPATALAVFPAVVLMLVANHQSTGNWLTMPYMVSRYQYGVPAAFTIQAPPVPHRELNREQALNYRMQLSFRASGAETLRTYFERLEYRVRFYRFFFLAPLYLAIPAFLFKLKPYRFLWVVLTLALFALGSNFYPNFEPHYIAAITSLLILVAITGLQQWERRSPAAARVIVFLCIAQFVFWYGLHVFDTQPFSMALRQYETWDGLNHRNPATRIAVDRQLDALPGKLLVFVRYYPQHAFQDEWVYNRADIDAARVVWARDLGPEEDAKLRSYFRDRAVWLLEPDFRPPRLTLYAAP